MYYINLLNGTQPEITEQEAESIIANESDMYHGQPITSGPYSDDPDNALGVDCPIDEK